MMGECSRLLLTPSLLVVMLLSLPLLSESRNSHTRGIRCSPDKLTVYRVYLNTMWSREVFPKQYPEWRPPAQWSKLIGRSHNSSYGLFKVNEPVSAGLKMFAEQGDTNLLDQESQGEGGIFDEFNAPPIKEGTGQSEAEFFIDGNHSRVSLVARVVPSPDWFIGVDSFDLCVEGLWIESVILEVDPLDAGSDNGFTFTSPNWPTIPQKPITRITARSPDHPANSFYYPDRVQHPPIATFQFVKVREYELSREFDPSPSPARQVYHPISSLSNSVYSSVRQDTTLHRQQEQQHQRSSHRRVTQMEDDFPVSNDVLLPSSSAAATMRSTAAARSSKHALLNSLMNKISKRRYKKNRRGRKMATRRRRDCVVSEWSEWSACSKTCGIGEQIRTRTVKKHARRQGKPCPILKENQWCGSSRDCIDHKYFDW
uniref:Spondin-2-like n=1 Tax=Hirondellea gigas TaxID=1518452 RepID=A0A6A7G5X0_9CRUS